MEGSFLLMRIPRLNRVLNTGKQSTDGYKLNIAQIVSMDKKLIFKCHQEEAYDTPPFPLLP